LIKFINNGSFFNQMVQKMTKWSYLKPFLFTRDSLHLLDVSRKLDENHSTVRKYLNEFVSEGFLNVFQKGRLTLYKINFNFPLLLDYLIIVEKEFLISKTNNIFRELVCDLQKISFKPLIIFGSSVTNFSTARDIDIVSLENINSKILSKKYNKDIHLVKVISLSEINSGLKQEILKNHIIINSIEEVIKWLTLDGV